MYSDKGEEIKGEGRNFNNIMCRYHTHVFVTNHLTDIHT